MAAGPGLSEGARGQTISGGQIMNAEIFESMLAAARAGDVWMFLLFMLALLCMVVWYDIRKEKRGKR